MSDRLLIAAPSSGSGKTLITCALIGALKERGIDICSFKCGPDYIDPMFHRTVLGIPSENLDVWFSGTEGLKTEFQEMLACRGKVKAPKMAVIEGVMGLYDGIGGTSQEGSAYHIADITGTPVILVIDVHGMGISMAALIRGFLEHDKKGLIKGVILNRISSSYFDAISPVLEKEFGEGFILGFFPKKPELSVESRHLGLRLPEEIADIRAKLSMASSQLEQSVDIDRMMQIASKAIDMEMPPGAADTSFPEREWNEMTLAVARDEAFCFYYEANLRELKNRGVKIIYFSPLHDKHLPEGISGLLLGGGYPELYADALSGNQGLLNEIRERIAEGLPSLAECGGFMYLHSSLEDADGRIWPLTGCIDGTVKKKDSLVRFGYVDIRENMPCFMPEGSSIKGHEFHYYDSDNNGTSCTAEKPGSGRKWQCIHEDKGRFWGFPHLYYRSAPEFVDEFVRQMRSYHRAAFIAASRSE